MICIQLGLLPKCQDLHRVYGIGHESAVRYWRYSISEQQGQNDDFIKWKHFLRYWPFVRGIHRSPVNSPHKGQWRGALMFLWSAPWINGWVNNREAGDLRHHRAHYDVIVMNVVHSHYLAVSFRQRTQKRQTPHSSPIRASFCFMCCLESSQSEQSFSFLPFSYYV